MRNIDGTGRIPINFTTPVTSPPISQLLQDPVNTSSSRNYYTYTTNGTQFEITAPMESAKDKLGGSSDVIGPDGSVLSMVYATGSNLALEPLDYGDGSLVGYWPFNKGPGTVAYDYSGNDATRAWNGSQTGSSGYYSAGKGGAYQLAGAFDGSMDYSNIGNISTLNLGKMRSACVHGSILLTRIRLAAQSLQRC